MAILDLCTLASLNRPRLLSENRCRSYGGVYDGRIFILLVLLCLLEFFEIPLDVLDRRQFFDLVGICFVLGYHINRAFLARLCHEVLHALLLSFIILRLFRFIARNALIAHWALGRYRFLRVLALHSKLGLVSRLRLNERSVVTGCLRLSLLILMFFVCRLLWALLVCENHLDVSLWLWDTKELI